MPPKNTGKRAKSKEFPSTDNLSQFALPSSLSCSEVEFPILIPTRKNKANWADILRGSDEKRQEIKNYTERNVPPVPKSPFLDVESEYIKEKVFPYLIPALEETLKKAQVWNVFEAQKSFFNGIDHIVQVLWNSNPLYPERKKQNLHLFNMPWVRESLEQKPRPYYPKSWLWPEDHAAAVIQASVRRFFVQRDPEVQEMREFWRKLAIEKNRPGITTNPLLAKKFALVPSPK
ncbi:IQ domain-containing protein K-like [Aricia agestis]|uniref:IQ domain-containing protein K-like n=1 Tax=Aricia agestis TaxID=91739 RepID=UPI001C202DE9|nr:IQ domain-containing protein K-like [Aricia agestis]